MVAADQARRASLSRPSAACSSRRSTRSSSRSAISCRSACRTRQRNRSSPDQDRAPLFETLERYAKGGIYPFHTPAHKGGQFADADLAALLGNRGLALDLPGMTATDNTFHPGGCVRDAQALAAELLGAQESFFLAAGSTLGVATALMAAVPPGATVAMPRNIHRSVVAGLVLSGARPRFMSMMCCRSAGHSGCRQRSWNRR